jgi:hypothetical protein
MRLHTGGSVATGVVGMLMLCAGCGSNPEAYDVVPVTGVVTCQGRPVANAIVNFTPQADPSRPQGRPGRVALGRTDEQGHFRLTTYQNDDGAIPGKHVVTVGLDSGDDSASVLAAKKFPCRDASREVTVAAGMAEITIDL